MEFVLFGGCDIVGSFEVLLYEVVCYEIVCDILYVDLVVVYGVYIFVVLGLYFGDFECLVNCVVLFGFDGCIGYQDKQIMIWFECEEWDVCGVFGLCVFDMFVGWLGILVCYDSEFFLLGC